MNDYATALRMVGWLDKYFLIQPDNTFWYKWNTRKIPIFSIYSPSESNNIQDPRAHDSTFINRISFLLGPNGQKKLSEMVAFYTNSVNKVLI